MEIILKLDIQNVFHFLPDILDLLLIRHEPVKVGGTETVMGTEISRLH